MTYILQPAQRAKIEAELLVPKGIVEVVPNRPFLIMVARMSSALLSLNRHTKLEELAEGPTTIVTTIDDFFAGEKAESVCAVPVYEGKVGK